MYFDVWSVLSDRFTIGDWAARDTFLPLDIYINRDRDKLFGVRAEDYYPACWKEANYTDPISGHHGIFAISSGIDDRETEQALF